MSQKEVTTDPKEAESHITVEWVNSYEDELTQRNKVDKVINLCETIIHYISGDTVCISVDKTDLMNTVLQFTTFKIAQK